MPVKRKPPAPTRRRQWLSWGTMASIAGVVSVLVSGAMWLAAHFQTVEAADLHAKEDRQEFMQLMHQLSYQETLTLRNRVSDCDVAVAKKRTMQPAEKAVCEQYRNEYKESNRRTLMLYQKTVEGSR